MIPPVPNNQELSFTWRDWFKQLRVFMLRPILESNSTYGGMLWVPYKGRPTNRTAGQVAMIYTTGGTTDNRTATPRPMYADGTDWRKFVDDTIWTG